MNDARIQKINGCKWLTLRRIMELNKVTKCAKLGGSGLLDPSKELRRTRLIIRIAQYDDDRRKDMNMTGRITQVCDLVLNRSLFLRWTLNWP